MRAFEIYLNRKKLCVAGVGNEGVLTAIVSWVTGRTAADLSLEVGGLISPVEAHLSWVRGRRLRVGDRVQVKVVEAKSVDKPKRRYRTDPVVRLRAQKRYVREMARQFGWKIEARSTPTTND
jgi:hypothetical protein